MLARPIDYTSIVICISKALLFRTPAVVFGPFYCSLLPQSDIASFLVHSMLPQTGIASVDLDTAKVRDRLLITGRGAIKW